MKLFSGFPSGKVEVTPLPNLFFSELCPAIDDLAELKVTLHVFWLIANRKGSAPRYVTTDELRADRTLMQSLAASDSKPDEAMNRGLTAATERGTLLHWSDVTESDSVSEELYFLNTERGRQAFEVIQRAEERFSQTTNREQASVGERPNIFVLYEQNIGVLNPIIAEQLKDAENEYPAEWFPDAFKEAVEHNALNWKYISKILENWKTKGRKQFVKRRKHWWDDEFEKYVKR